MYVSFRWLGRSDFGYEEELPSIVKVREAKPKAAIEHEDEVWQTG